MSKSVKDLLYGITLKEIKGHFNCNIDESDFETEKFTSLEGCPEIVGGDFSCGNNDIESLEHCPKKIGGSFDCALNPIESLEGCPKIINGSFSCRETRIESFEGGPEFVKDVFDACYNDYLKSLKGLPKKIGVHCYIYYCENLRLKYGRQEDIIEYIEKNCEVGGKIGV